jgi:multiple sugar transport system substrate-binding protein
MDEITFSIFNHSPAASAQMTTLLKQFEREEKVRVRLDVIPWNMGWQKLIEMGLYHIGADISEIGSTWIMDFVRMNVLRAYSQMEANEITGGQKYFDSTWTGGISKTQQGRIIWGIPFAGDARAVFYRKDWLKKAGVDEETAFKGPSRFDYTLAAIQKAGCPMPLSLSVGPSRNNIHSLGSWIWGLGGEFLSADGNSIEFDHERALDGAKAYFGLGHYLGKERLTTETDSDSAFHQGRSAVTISGCWILPVNKPAEVTSHLGVAPVPGVPFVGGEHLVIWKHSRRQEQSLRLAKFLARPESSELLYPFFGLPVAIDGWDHAPFTEPNYQAFRNALQNGRGFPPGQLWGLVEKRLQDTLPEIWAEVLARPERTDSIVENYLGALAKQLQTTLKR